MQGRKSRPANKAAGKKRAGAKRRTGPYSTRRIIGWLIGCFPAGLYMMWSPKCRWNFFVKTLVSAIIAACVVFIIIPQTEPPQRYVGGVELKTLSAEADQGPLPTADFERIDLYNYNIISDSVLASPEPTEVPVYVYCNNGGKYYHSAECTYVKKTSTHCTLLQALNAGYKQCPDCNAPKGY